MSEALFALAGTVVGVLGTVLTALVTAKHEERHEWRNDVRSICADLAAEVTHLQDVSHQLRKDQQNKQLQNKQLQSSAEDAHTRARGLQERLRLTSRSQATQKLDDGLSIAPTTNGDRPKVDEANFGWPTNQSKRG